MSLLHAIFIAFIQGATELFPVSSLGHAVILPGLLKWDLDQHSPAFLPFLVVLHLGTAAALVIYFWRDWYGFLRGVLGVGAEVARERRTFFLIVVATIPAAFIGFFLEHILRSFFGSPKLAALFLFLNGFILFVGERLKRVGHKNIQDIGWLAAIIIGTCQALALIPGISRSGSTIVGGLLAGLTPKEAARFSFLLATPIIAGAGVLEVPKLRHMPHVPGYENSFDISIVLASGAVAGVVAYLSLVFLMRYFKKKEIDALDPFAYYCWLAGFLALTLLMFR